MSEILINKRITCKNGASLSIQANEYAYASPRVTGADYYDCCEVGFIEGTETPDYFRPYADGDFPSDVYGYVPVELVERFIQENGGINLGVMLGRNGAIAKIK